MPRYYARQVVLIPQGTEDLGLALAHRFGKAGLRLVLAGAGEAELQAARAALLAEGSIRREEDVLLVRCEPRQGKALIDATIAAFGRIDLVVCGGDGEFGQADGAFESSIDTLQASLPHLLDPLDGDESLRGIVLFVGQNESARKLRRVSEEAVEAAFFRVFGWLRRDRAADISAALRDDKKAGDGDDENGVGDFSKALYDELWPYGIRVTAVFGGLYGEENREDDAEKIYKAVQRGLRQVTLKRKASLIGGKFGRVPETTPDPLSG